MKIHNESFDRTYYLEVMKGRHKFVNHYSTMMSPKLFDSSILLASDCLHCVSAVTHLSTELAYGGLTSVI